MSSRGELTHGTGQRSTTIRRAPPPSAPETTTAQWLADLTTHLAEILTLSRDFHHPSLTQYICKDLEAYTELPACPPAYTHNREAFIQRFRDSAGDNGCHASIVHVTANVDAARMWRERRKEYEARVKADVRRSLGL